MRRLHLVTLTVVAALAVAATASAMTIPKLIGTVGPGFTISLKKPVTGLRVTTVKAGKYTFVVTDKATIHDFHLVGPGVNRVITTVGFTGIRTLTLTLKVGLYRFFCDPHSSTMRGSFRVTP